MSPILLDEGLLDLNLADEVVIDLGDGLAEVEVLACLNADLEAVAEARLVFRRERVAALVAEPDHEERVGEDVHGLDLPRCQVGHPEADG